MPNTLELSEDLSVEDRIAREHFTPDKFVKRESVAMLAEHTKEKLVPDKKNKGKFVREEIVYDRELLQKIIDKNNARIRDTGDFAPLVAGHTSDDGDSMIEPEVLGYIGNFRLGTIGEENPRYAIIADEYHRIDKADILDNRRRRSAEVWMRGPEDEWYLDPVAALGATTPMLDMGLVRYAKHSSGEMVAKYQAAACGSPAMPSGSNTFVPSTDITKDKNQQEIQAMDEDAVVRKCVEAVSAMLPKLMDDYHAQKQAEAEAAAAVDRNEMQATDDKTMYSADGDTAMDEQATIEEVKEGEETGKTEEVAAKYQREQKRIQDAHSRELKAMKDKNARMEAQLHQMEQKATDAERAAKIAELRQTRAFDEERYLSRCLYSRGSKMNAEAFADLCDTIEDLSQPIPVGMTLPRAVEPRFSAEDKDKNARIDKARQIGDAVTQRNSHISWGEAFELAAKPDSVDSIVSGICARK